MAYTTKRRPGENLTEHRVRMENEARAQADPTAVRIPIERRETIGEVILSQYGVESPIHQAMAISADYLSENVQRGQGMALQFTLFDHTYSIDVKDTSPKVEEDREA